MTPTTPSQPEPGLDNLRRAVATLPTHEPDPAGWLRIATQLAADQALAQAIPDLPAHEPDEALWSTLAARLDAPAAASPVAAAPAPTLGGVGRRLWPTRAGRRALAVAASLLLLLLGGWWGLRPAPQATQVAAGAAGPHESVAYSEEVTIPASLPAPADPLEQQGLQFIDAHCSSLPGVCQSGEFRSLRAQLTELETQEARLRLDVRRFGASPELLREQAQLTTLKATLTRELVQLLLS